MALSIEEKIARLRAMQVDREGEGGEVTRSERGERKIHKVREGKTKVIFKCTDEAWKRLCARSVEAVRKARKTEWLRLVATYGGTISGVRQALGNEQNLTGGRSVGEGITILLVGGEIKGIDCRPEWLTMDEVERLQWADDRAQKLLDWRGPRGGLAIVRTANTDWWDPEADGKRGPHTVLMPSSGMAVGLEIADRLGIVHGRRGWGGDGPRVGTVLEAIGMGWIK